MQFNEYFIEEDFADKEVNIFIDFISFKWGKWRVGVMETAALFFPDFKFSIFI